MNTDVGDLIKQINIKDPISTAIIMTLIVGILFFALTFRAYGTAVGDRKAKEASSVAALKALDEARNLEEANPEALRAKVEEKQAELSGLLAGFPTTEEATNELANYYAYASEYDAQLVRMEARLPVAGGDTQTAYQAEYYTLEARGEFRNLLRFWSRLVSGPYETFALDNLTIAPDGPAISEADLSVVYSDLAAPEPGEAAPAN